MSAFGDLRDALHELHEFLPLTEREKQIFGLGMQCGGDFSDIDDDPTWYGEKAIEAWKAVTDE